MKILSKNKRARFDYDIKETIEAGIMLTGAEVKSCRAGQVNLTGAYVSMRGPQPVIKHMTIAPYVYATQGEGYNPSQERVLLLTKQQIETLKSMEQEKGTTILPMEVHGGRHIKVLIGIGRGRKKHDKRARIKERDTEKRLRKGEEL